MNSYPFQPSVENFEIRPINIPNQPKQVLLTIIIQSLPNYRNFIVQFKLYQRKNAYANETMGIYR